MPTENQKVKRTSRLPVRGDLGLTVRDAKTGKSLRRIQIRNTITYVGLASLVQLLAQKTGSDPTTFTLAALHVGDGVTPPVRGDTTLVNDVATIPLSDVNKTVTLTGPYELKITATLDADTGNGHTLSEAALFTGVPGMFARQVHPGVSKTAAIVIDYDWRVSFTA